MLAQHHEGISQEGQAYVEKCQSYLWRFFRSMCKAQQLEKKTVVFIGRSAEKESLGNWLQASYICCGSGFSKDAGVNVVTAFEVCKELGNFFLHCPACTTFEVFA